MAERSEAQRGALNERVVVVAPTLREAERPARILRDADVGVDVRTDEASLGPEDLNAGAILIAQESVGGANLALLIEAVRSQPEWSDIPVIVLTRRGVSDEASSANVQALLSIANAALFERPLRPSILVSTVRTALRARRRQYLLAEHLRLRRIAEEGLLERENRLAFLDRLSEATRSESEPEAILKIATRLVAEHMGAHRCAYADMEEDGDHFTIRQDYGASAASSVGRYRLTDFGPRAVAELNLGRPLVIRDMDLELAPGEGNETFTSLSIKAIICCPLVKAGRMRGMMAVHSATPRDWTLAEIALLREVVDRCWAWIERARAEIDLRESESRLRTMVDNIPQLAWMADETGKIRWYNRRWYEFTGATPEDLQGDQGWHGYLHPEHRARVVQRFTEAIQSARAWEDTFPLRGKEGMYRWFLAQATPLRDDWGRVSRWFGTNTDVTPQREAQRTLAHHNELLNQAVDMARAELEIANERHRLAERMAALGTMAAGLGHDIGNLLLPLRAHVDALRYRPGRNAEDATDLAAIDRCADHFASLVRGLRLFGRGEAADQPKASTDVHDWCSDVLTLLRNLAGGTIWLRAECAPDMPRVQIGPGALTQIVTNLVKNAADAIRAGKPDGKGHISIEIAQGDGGAWVRVIDDGPGMSPEVRARCLEPYFTTRVRGQQTGTGLGLAVVHRLVTEAMGRLEIETHEGSGTTVRVWLPVALDRPAAKRPKAWVRVSDSRTRGVTIAMLRASGYDTEQSVREPDREADLWIVDSLRVSEVRGREPAGNVILLSDREEPVERVIPGRVVHLPRRPKASEIIAAVRANPKVPGR